MANVGACATAGDLLPLNSQGSLVHVTWTDAKDASQTVSIASVLAWDNPATAAAIKSGGLQGGNTVLKPTGKTKVGGTLAPGSSTGNPDGTRTHRSSDGKYVQLLDSTGKVLLTTECSQTGNWTNCDFSTISGYVYIDYDNNADPANIFVMSSDAAYCDKKRTTPSDPDSALLLEYVNASGSIQTTAFSPANTNKYKRFYYTCYVGPGWFGRVGVVRTDNANTNDRVCMGDPSITTSTDLTGRQPQLATARDYRGFKNTNATVPIDGTTSDGTPSGSALYDITIGIGMNATNTDSASWSYSPRHYGNYDIDGDGLASDEYDDYRVAGQVRIGSSGLVENTDSTSSSSPGTTLTLERQDFLITTITGNPADSNCKGKLELAGTDVSSPFYTGSGKFVCLTRNETGQTAPTYPLGCPSIYPTNPAPTTLIVLTFPEGSYDRIAGITTDGGSCSTATNAPPTIASSLNLSLDTNHDYAVCTIDWTGWIGSTWTGTVTITPKTNGGSSSQGKICNSNTNTVTDERPTNYDGQIADPAQSGGATAASPNGQTPLVLTYTGVPPAVTAFKQSVNVLAVDGNCAQ